MPRRWNNPDIIKQGDLIVFPYLNTGIQNRYVKNKNLTKDKIGLVVGEAKEFGDRCFWCLAYGFSEGIFRIPLRVEIDDINKFFRFRYLHDAIKKKIITGAMLCQNKPVRELAKVYNFTQKNKCVMKCESLK
jgi:hypothetical protein